MNLTEISKITGYSVSVVSRALNPSPDKSCTVSQATRNKIRKAVQDLDFKRNYSAACVRRKQTPSIGVFLPTFSRAVICDAIIGISEEASKANLSLNFYFGGSSDFPNFLYTVNLRKNLGIIVYYHGTSKNQTQTFASQIKEFCRIGGKAVLFNTEPEDDCFATEFASGCMSLIRFDDYSGGWMNAEYLYQKNCKYYTACYFPGKCYQDRIEGFCDFFKEKGIEAGHEFLFLPTNDRHADVALFSDFLKRDCCKKNLPVGLFVPGDCHMLRALGLIEKMKLRHGRDIFLNGYDDSDFTAYIQNDFVTTEQDFRHAGAEAMRLLLAMLDGEKSEKKLLMPKLEIFNHEF